MAQTTTPGREGWGVDLDPRARPGVPRERPPHRDPGAYWVMPDRQEQGVSVLEGAGIRRVTPVFGTAQPVHGLSGRVRRAAYRVPEQFVRHWVLLMLADRVEVLVVRLRHSRPALPWLATAALAFGLARRM